jgi:sugar O-acyltransferase (sialic acid O-acetyltransferase NeuD family)
VKKIILVGACLEDIELCDLCGYKIVGIIDNNEADSFWGVHILGKDSDAEQLAAQYSDKTELYLTQDQPATRKRLFEYYESFGFQFATVISPRAFVSKTAIVGKGTIVQSGVNIASNTIIGDFVCINTNANIMHDCNIGAFTTIAPNAVVLGRVLIKGFAYVGANSTILPDLEIAANTIVGAGAVVTKNVLANETVVGVPARLITEIAGGV